MQIQMVNLLGVVGTCGIIVLSILVYNPLNKLLSSAAWQYLSYGPAIQVMLPVFLLLFCLASSVTLFLITEDD